MSWGNAPGWRPSAAPRGGLSGAIWTTLVRLWETLGDSGRFWAPRLSLAEAGFLEPLCTEAKGCQRKPGSRVSQSLPESTRVSQRTTRMHQKVPETHQNVAEVCLPAILVAFVCPCLVRPPPRQKHAKRCSCLGKGVQKLSQSSSKYSKCSDFGADGLRW